MESHIAQEQGKVGWSFKEVPVLSSAHPPKDGCSRLNRNQNETQHKNKGCFLQTTYPTFSTVAVCVLAQIKQQTTPLSAEDWVNQLHTMG